MYMFFFSSRRRHTRSLCDWSSDVCSSDLSTRWRAASSPILPAPTRSTVRPDKPSKIFLASSTAANETRSEERRVGKECRYRWSPNPYKKKEEAIRESTTKYTARHEADTCA